MVINTNMRAIEAYRDSKTQDVNLRKAQEKLSSGIRINHAADDAAGVAIASKMQAQARGLDRAEMNIGEGIDLLTVADGTCETLSDMTNRIRELTVQAANDTNVEEDRQHIQTEINSLLDGMDSAVRNLQYNTVPICSPVDPNSGFFAEPDPITKELSNGMPSSYILNNEYLWLQIGANAMHGNEVALQDLRLPRIFPGEPWQNFNDGNGPNGTATLDNVKERLLVTSSPPGTVDDAVKNCYKTLGQCDIALEIINSARASYGAWMTTLASMESYDRIASLNTKDAMSRIYDADMAKETMNQSKSMVMMNTSIAMLAQANQSTERVLSLLG